MNLDARRRPRRRLDSANHILPRFSLALLAGLLTVGGCRAADPGARVTTADTPFALDSISITSDARLDANHRLLGSFVGEGTNRAIHLLSNDTALIATLYRRYGEPLSRGESLWSRLQVLGSARLRPGDGRTGPRLQETLAGFAGGLTRVQPVSVILHGSSCGPLHSRIEIIVGEASGEGPSPVQGPVLGSFQTQPRSDLADGEIAARPATQMPGQAMIDSLIARTERAFDDAVARRLAPELLPLQAPSDRYLEINTLADIDAADIVPFWGVAGQIRYVVALRVRRITAHADTLLVAGVMTWDSAGQGGRTVLRPTAMRLDQGQVAALGADWAPAYWRRLEAIAGFGSGSDYLWLEQVRPDQHAVLWGVLAPVSNTVVAAARVDGSCDGREQASSEGN